MFPDLGGLDLRATSPHRSSRGIGPRSHWRSLIRPPIVRFIEPWQSCAKVQQTGRAEWRQSGSGLPIIHFQATGRGEMSAKLEIAKHATAEADRLAEAREQKSPWKKWGPYLSERPWGTVREDYSGNAMPGTSSLMIMRALAPIVGGKTDWRGSPTTSHSSVSPSPCGTARTRFSRSVSSD
jgi:hypothetical protein